MKKQQRSKGTWDKNRWLWILVTVFAVILFGLILHHHVQTSAQNKTFKETQSWLNNIADDTAMEITGNRISEEYCHRGSVKYGEGERYCIIDENILYPVESNKFEEITANVQAAITKYSKVKMDAKGANSNSNIISSYLFTYKGLGCSVEYFGLRDKSSFGYLTAINNFTNGLRVLLSCSGPAMADYFPNRN